MPQMNVYMVAIPIKIYIGLFLMLAFLSATNMFIQNIIKKYNPTMIFVEHDETFSCNIATKKLILERNKESTKIEDLKNCL